LIVEVFVPQVIKSTNPSLLKSADDIEPEWNGSIWEILELIFENPVLLYWYKLISNVSVPEINISSMLSLFESSVIIEVLVEFCSWFWISWNCDSIVILLFT
jgi:hypothetical protein